MCLTPQTATRGKSLDARHPEDWSLQERLPALQQGHGLNDEALNAWWRAQFCSAGGSVTVSELAWPDAA